MWTATTPYQGPGPGYAVFLKRRFSISPLLPERYSPGRARRICQRSTPRDADLVTLGPENHKKPVRDPHMNSMLIIGLSLLVLGMILRYAARKL